MHPRTVLRTQIRNVLRKWQQKSRKHRIETHFPKHRNCEVCSRTKMTRDPGRRCTGEALLRAETEKFGDLITTDHKVLNEGCEFRGNHRYAVVVQDLATQRIQSYPCKTKTSHETERSLSKMLGAVTQTKSHLDKSLEFGKACEDLSWNYRTSTPHRSETNGIAERDFRRVKRRHFSSVAKIRTGWKMVVWFYGMPLLSARCPRPPGGSENSEWNTNWRTSQTATDTFWSNGWISSDFTDGSVKNSSIWQEIVTRNLSCLWVSRGVSLEKEIFW